MILHPDKPRMIGALDNEAPADQRLGGTVALHYQAAAQGAQLLRVHDIAENRLHVQKAALALLIR